MRTWTFGSELKQIREAAGLSQEDVAKALDVRLGTYGSWERGTHAPRREALDRIVEFFNVPPAAIGLEAPDGWELVPAAWIRESVAAADERAAVRHRELMAELALVREHLGIVR
jgi:transcriptional regulator with XRE-family HTH domain